ncbi:MAG TPA: aminotransferase class IV, partial [Candidatus Polarisedimenticolia bacterium]|nr:aminotransferase class IV [Candidatus Polarisedimenticolia bacterium]
VSVPVASNTQPERQPMPAVDPTVESALDALREVGRKARVFVSMPWVEGITPRVLSIPATASTSETKHGVPRRHGIFRLDEIGIPLLDHDVLYGDACFEGILIKHGRVFLLGEHLDRFWRSARELGIVIPYDRIDLTTHLLETIRQVSFEPQDNSYIRLVVTRGLGDLGINPKKCVGPTLFALVSTIRLYPPEAYTNGIALGIARTIRRPGANILDPRIKSNNYLNNVLALREGCDSSAQAECVMLNQEGFVAEATVDNIFLVLKEEGWEKAPSRVRVLTPSPAYCLNGITRMTILRLAGELGYSTQESPSLLPLDLVGERREVFMTGTGAFVMPITSVAGHRVGDGRPGEVTRILLRRITETMAESGSGLDIQADTETIRRYLGA